MKIAQNSSLKGENCKEFTLKGWKMQKIHPSRVKKNQNFKEFTITIVIFVLFNEKKTQVGKNWKILISEGS